MANKPQSCDSCLKLCDEAKQNVKNLQKKVYVMTIVCTSAITLLGEQGAKALLSAISTTTSAMKAVEQDKAPEEPTEDKPEKANEIGPGLGAWNVPNKKIFAKKEYKEPTKPYELVDELSRFPEIEETEQEGLSQQVIDKIVETAVEGTVAEQLPIEETPKIAFNTTDNHAVFFTPSSMPFDVYVNTLGLGVNYGLGEYYGIETGYSAVSVPGPGAISLLALLTTLTTRKRS